MFEIVTTEQFDAWFEGQTGLVRTQIARRLDRIKGLSHFGDFKSLSDGLFELRFTIEGGLRVYYAFNGKTVVLLLTGGNKGSQKRDILKAREMIRSL